MPAPILLPAPALIGWSIAVLLQTPHRRIKAKVTGKVTEDELRFGELEWMSRGLWVPSRGGMNLLEMPVLFYLAMAILVVARLVLDPGVGRRGAAGGTKPDLPRAERRDLVFCGLCAQPRASDSDFRAIVWMLIA